MAIIAISLTAASASCATNPWKVLPPQTPALFTSSDEFSPLNFFPEQCLQEEIREQEFSLRLHTFERICFDQLKRDINFDERHKAREVGLRWKDVPRETKLLIKHFRSEAKSKEKAGISPVAHLRGEKRVVSDKFCATWDQLFETYRELLGDHSVLAQQYRSYVAHEAPAIVDPRIKEIPILENDEGLIDLREVGDDRLQMLPSPQFPFEKPFLNSGLPSASKMRAGLYRKLRKMSTSLDRLANTFGYEPGQISIRVFEGLRDLDTQSTLFQKKLEEILKANPLFTMEEAERETAKWVSPVKNNVPVHSTGGAVDIRLWDSYRGEFLDMGVFGVIWGANENAPTFSANISDRQRKNRFYCLLAAEEAGLTNYSFEFWHFSSGDRNAVYWENRHGHATYGSV